MAKGALIGSQSGVSSWTALACVAIAVVSTYALMKVSPSSAPVPALAPPAVPPPAPKVQLAPLAPAHRYSVREGVEYSYERALSSVDKLGGSIATPMLTVRYLGLHDGHYQIFHKINGAVIDVYDCEGRACEFITVYRFVNEEHVDTQKMRLAQGTVVAAMFEDAIADRLEPHVYIRNGKPHQGWIDRSGNMKFSQKK